MTGLSEDQQALVGLADDVFAGRTGNDQLAKTELTETRIDEELWRDLADAGLVGIGVGEAFGGAGLGLIEVCLLVEAQGRRLAPVPLAETAVAALVLQAFAPLELQTRWLPGVAQGTVQLACALDLTGSAAPTVTATPGAEGGWTLHGSLAFVPRAESADALLVVALDESGEPALFLVETGAPGIIRHPVVTTDHSLAADVDLEGAAAVRLGGPDAVQGAIDRTRLALAAQLLGAADAGVRETALFLSNREQFGRPLATFQATTQQLGDAYCDVQAQRATLWQAVWALDTAAPDARRAVDVATWWATDAAQRVQHTVQHLHGGLGADTTYPVHRRLLWTMRAVSQLGGSSRQLVRLGRSVLTPGS